MQSVERVLVDTSLWVDYLRGKDLRSRQAVATLLLGSRAYTCGVVLTELLAGALNDQDRQRIDTLFRGLPYQEITRASWLAAGGLDANLRSRGVTLPLADLLISATALEHGCHVYTMDTHFRSVPGLAHYRAI